MSYPVEEIQDEHRLYRRVADNRFNAKGRPAPGAFKERGKGMSSDWSKYATAADSLKGSPDPDKWGVVSLEVADLRGLGLQVEHTPRSYNRAHADVTGIEGDEEMRMELARIAAVQIESPRKRHTNNP
jgi:hypothetical protein